MFGWPSLSGMLKDLGNFDGGCNQPAGGAPLRVAPAWAAPGSPFVACPSLPNDHFHPAPSRRAMQIPGEKSGAAVDAGHLHAQLRARSDGPGAGLHRPKADGHPR